MREQLERRLQQLKDEYAQGEKTLEDLQAKTAGVQRVMLRLSGAIQVLEEELAAENAPQPSGDHSVYSGNGTSDNGAEPGTFAPNSAPAALPGRM